MTLTPTAEQSAIISAARRGENCFVDAMAGTAKTTTLQMIANEALPQGGLALAFNVRIKKELEDRFPSTWTVLTMNGLGHRAWCKAISRRCEVDQKKLARLTSQWARGVSQADWSTIRELVSKAMLYGLVPSTHPHRGLVPDTPDTWAEIADAEWLTLGGFTESARIIYLAREVLIASVKESFSGVVSFDDQLYMSALYNGQFTRYPHVVMDEAQDLSSLNHIMLSRCAAGPIIAVGDTRQSIYQFRGAASDSMGRIHQLRQDWAELQLTTTFRCPHKIVSRQQRHAPGYNAYKTNPQGRVLMQSRERLGVDEEHWGQFAGPENDNQRSWSWADVMDVGFREVSIISRNNAQVVSMAFKLLRQRVSVRMLGRDIGKNLAALSKKLLPNDETPAAECFSTIFEWQEHQTELARANKHEEKIAGITDRAESLLAVLEGSGADSAGKLRAELLELFNRETGVVTLSTGHRAKGFEYETVLLLDPWRIPSRYATKAAAAGNTLPMEAERNLQYVIETRTKQALILANLEDFT